MTACSRRRILSVWLQRLSTDRIERRSSAPAETPLVTVATVKSALRIAALNGAAAQLGLSRGMALADARAMYPSLDAADAEPEADRRLLENIADWCERYTPLIGLDPPDGLLLDITGCAHLFGGEAALCRDLCRRLATQGFHVRVAAADNVGTAHAVARYGDAGIVPSDASRAALLPLPVAALRIDADIAFLMGQAGLKRIRDAIDLPRSPLAARFGTILVRRIDQALGREDEPITPRKPPPSYLVERRFADPIGREEDVLGTIEYLAQELSRVLERHGEGARLIQAALFRTDGKVARIEIGTGEPLRDAARMRRLFTDKLTVLADEYDPGFGFDVVRLAALTTERSDPVQTGLGGADHAVELAHLIDRLSARFGARRVLRLIPRDTHIPEFAVAAMPAHAVSFSPPPLRGRSDREAIRVGGKFVNAPFASYPPPQPSPTRGEGEERCSQDSLAPIRPIRLFEHPEPVEAIAEIPDGPPVRFRWRRILHEIAHAEGPERIAMEWWRDDRGNKLTRDYFRIESREGARIWLYRQGLYDREVEFPEQPRWYVHGLFA